MSNFDELKYFKNVYLREHRNNVGKGVLKIIRSNVLEKPDQLKLIKSFKQHDLDKLKPPLIKYYPRIIAVKNGLVKGELDPEKQTLVTVIHIRQAAHHPEYWDDNYDPELMFNKYNRDEPGLIKSDARKMPLWALAEMVADISSFSINEGDPSDALNWFNTKTINKFVFSNKQLNLIYKFFNIIFNLNNKN